MYYIAPEVIKSNYDEKCDIWSCGVILYILLNGKPPFHGSNKKEILSRITKGVYTFQDPQWTHVSKEAKNLIKKMLMIEPALRYSAEQVYNDPWIQQRALSNIEDNELSAQVLSELANFSGKVKIRQATLQYIVCQMVTSREVEDLRKIFIELDLNGDGSISIQELEQGLNRVKLETSYNIQDILDQCDANLTGVIDYTEFLTATLNWKKSLSQERLEMAFQAYDTDKNGKISLEEMKEFIGDDNLEDEVWEELFKEADVNADGCIDLEEFKVIMLNL